MRGSPESISIIELLKLIYDLFLSIMNTIFKKSQSKYATQVLKVGKSNKITIRKGCWDSAVVLESWFLHEYLRHFRQKSFFEESAVLIDIGAHIGSFSIYAASRFKNCKIISLEPDPNNFCLLEKNIELNNFINIVPLNLGLTDKTIKKSILELNDNNLGMHKVILKKKEANKNQKLVTVNMTTLKEIFDKFKIKECQLLKMDCEGCEFSVLKTTPQSLLKKIERISLEYHCEEEVKDLKAFLEKSGYKTKIDKAIPLPVIGRFVKAPLLVAWR